MIIFARVPPGAVYDRLHWMRSKYQQRPIRWARQSGFYQGNTDPVVYKTLPRCSWRNYDWDLLHFHSVSSFLSVCWCWFSSLPSDQPCLSCLQQFLNSIICGYFFRSGTLMVPERHGIDISSLVIQKTYINTRWYTVGINYKNTSIFILYTGEHGI